VALHTTNALIDPAEFSNYNLSISIDEVKSDILAKCFLLMQTGWFILQWIARGVEHLHVTELEIITLAFAILNFATYAFWWNKPYNVQSPICVTKRVGVQTPGGGGNPGQSTDSASDATIASRFTHVVWSIFLEFAKMAFGIRMDNNMYTPGRNSETGNWWDGIGAVVFAIIFGGIHCIAWSFEFHSSVYRLLWHVCSVVLVCTPLPMWLNCVLLIHKKDKIPNGMERYTVLYVLGVLIGIAYVVARVGLLVVAFTSLSSLPPDAYRAVHWTTFIPHV
jgi:hypothetical protein